MVKYSDIAVRGTVENVQSLVQQALVGNGFQVKWEGPTKGTAERGSKGANLMLGALSQYYRVDFEIYPMASGATLRLLKGNTGMAGGLLGMSKVNKQFVQLSDTLASWFNQQGVLEGVKKE